MPDGSSGGAPRPERARRPARVAVLVAAGLGLVGLAYRLRSVLAPFLMAGVLAYLMHPLVACFERRRVPRTLAILLVYAIFGVAGVIIYYAAVPPLAHELSELMTVLPQQSERLQGMTQGAVDGLHRLSLPRILDRAVDRTVERTERLLERMVERVADATVGLFSSFFSFILAPILAYYFLQDRERLAEGLMGLIPPAYRAECRALGRAVDEVVSGFLRGQLIVSLLIGAIIGAGLALLKVRYALVVGLIAGLFDIIPYFGPVIGAIPAVALGLLRSPWTAVSVAVLIFAVHQFEGSILSPKIVGRSVGLHPLAIILAVLAGGELAGILGMLVAVPAAAAGKVLVRYAWPRLTAAWWAGTPEEGRPAPPGVDKERGMD